MITNIYLKKKYSLFQASDPASLGNEVRLKRGMVNTEEIMFKNSLV